MTPYVFAFTTERPLTEKPLRSICVRTKRRGLNVSVAVEPGR